MSDQDVEGLKQKTDDVKKQMASNLAEVQRRGDNLEQVEETSRQLNETTHLFNLSSRSLQRKYCFKNIKLWIILIVIVSVILLTLISECTACCGCWSR
jgi:hypothetical protein